jgi:hypothetical protein
MGCSASVQTAAESVPKTPVTKRPMPLRIDKTADFPTPSSPRRPGAGIFVGPPEGDISAPPPLSSTTGLLLIMSPYDTPHGLNSAKAIYSKGKPVFYVSTELGQRPCHVDLASGLAAGGVAESVPALADTVLPSVLAAMRTRGRYPDVVMVFTGEGAAPGGGGAGSEAIQAVQAALGTMGLVIAGCSHTGTMAYGLAKSSSGGKGELVVVNNAAAVAVCAIWSAFTVSRALVVGGFALTASCLRADQGGTLISTFSGSPAYEAYTKNLPRGAASAKKSPAMHPLARVIGHDEDGEPLLSLLGVAEGPSSAPPGSILLSEPVKEGEELYVVAGTADDILLGAEKGVARAVEAVQTSLEEAFPDARSAPLYTLMFASSALYGPAGLKATVASAVNKDLKSQFPRGFPREATRLLSKGGSGCVFGANVLGPCGSRLVSGASMVSAVIFSPDITPLFYRTDADLAADIGVHQEAKRELSDPKQAQPSARSARSAVSKLSRLSASHRNDVSFHTREHYAQPGMLVRLRLAYVVSDVESSTELWQAARGAGAAIIVHDLCLRRQMAVFRGYECRSLGDSFHVVFSSVFDAAGFCLAATMALWLESWPSDCEAFAASRSGGRYSGIGVRFGIEASAEYQVTTDVDAGVIYSGKLVKNSKVVSDRGHGGQTLLTLKAADILKPHLKYLPGPPASLLPTSDRSVFHLVNDKMATLNESFAHLGLRV